MNNARTIGIIVVLFLAFLLARGAAYVVNETEQVVITQFGKPVGDPVSTPGLKFKVPFIQKVNRFDRRYLEWDGDQNQLPTRDKRFIFVDTYARWRISDPLLYFQRLRDERGAQTRLDDIRDGTTNTLLASEIILVKDGPIGSGEQDIRGRYHNVRHAGALFSTKYPPNTSQPDRHNYCSNKLPEAPCTPTGTNVIVSARSYHSGGVMCALADGSVRFLSETVDSDTYHALGTRAGGEVIPGNF